MLRQKNMLSDFCKTYKVHLIGWTLFLSYEITMTGLINNKFNTFLYYLVFYVLNITLFYFFAHKILPFALKNKRIIYVLLPLSLATTLVTYYAITIGLDSALSVYYDDDHTPRLIYSYVAALRSIYRFLLFIGFSTGYYFLITFLKERRRVESTEKEKLLTDLRNQEIKSELVRSQMAFLKAQINPHFLFNTLSYLYSNTRKIIPETAEAIMALAEIMRFSIDIGSRQDESPILVEIEQAHNLIFLHKLRVSGVMHIDVQYDEDELEGVKVIPLLIITLIENMFKHGNLEGADRPGKIVVTRSGGKLRIVATNFKHDGVSRGHNIGLANVRNRLNMSYGSRAELTTDETDPSIFKTIISIG